MASTKTVSKSQKAKRKFRFQSISVNIVFAIAIAFLFAELFLRSVNNSLSARTQEIQTEITTLQTENDTVELDIQTLEKRDRITEAVASEGMTNDSDSVITISAYASSSSEESE